MIIYGAGMSGLLAATMLRRYEPVIYEIAPELPNNHTALLRFRSDAVGRETGIPFKKVWVQKAVVSEDGQLSQTPSIKDQNLYSLKVTGDVKGRSIMNLDPGERYIAPPDFIAQLAKGLQINFNCSLSKENINETDSSSPNQIISTIPMSELMRIIGWSDIPLFQHKSITTINADISGCQCDIYQTIYVPDLENQAYRVSITGNRLIIEMIGDVYNGNPPGEESLRAFCAYYGKLFFGHKAMSRIEFSNITHKHQKYGKLINSTGQQGKQFILAMTDLYGVYSLGRFATWRQILMDDVVKDIKIIESMIEQRDNYSRRLRVV